MCAHLDLNQRPFECESNALPTELCALITKTHYTSYCCICIKTNLKLNDEIDKNLHILRNGDIRNHCNNWLHVYYSLLIYPATKPNKWHLHGADIS